VNDVRKSVIAISSFLVGVSCMTITSAFAQTPLKQVKAFIRNDLTIKVNGKETQTNNDIIIYNDRTYLALRDIEEVSGIMVGWDQKKKEISIKTETSDPSNSSNTNSDPVLIPIPPATPFEVVDPDTKKIVANAHPPIVINGITYVNVGVQLMLHDLPWDIIKIQYKENDFPIGFDIKLKDGTVAHYNAYFISKNVDTNSADLLFNTSRNYYIKEDIMNYLINNI
jgi:hypothetical protein